MSLHPSSPPLLVREAVPGRHLLVHAPPDGTGLRRVEATWLFATEPRASGCRVVSRYRRATSGDLVTRLAFGPALTEPIGSAMDRRMLRGIRGRAERPSWS